MKVLHILHSHHLGGAERHALTLMTGLRARGVAVAYAGQAGSWLSRAVQAEGIEWHPLPMRGFYDLRSMWRLGRLLRRSGADLVHGHLTRGAHYAAIGGRLAGRPAVATAHSTNAGKHFGGLDHIIAVSDAVRDFLQGRGYAAGRITRIHNGVPDQPPPDPAARAALRAALAIPPQRVAVAGVARFIRDKGQDIALRALARLGEPAVHLYLIGDAGTPWGREMQGLAAELGLGERVHFLGQRDDVAAVLGAMDAVVMPSRREAISLSLLEACSLGLPVVASRVGGIPEVIEDGRSGLLVPAEDDIALAAALGRLAADPALRRQLGEAARARFLARFTAARMVEATARLYERVLAEAA